MSVRIKVVGYMELDQFEDNERDETRPSGLTEQVEKDMLEEFQEDMDDVTMELLTDEFEEVVELREEPQP